MSRTIRLALASLLLFSSALSAFDIFGEPYGKSQIPVPVSADRDLCPDCPNYYKPYIKAGNTWNNVSCSYFAFREGNLRDRDAFRCDGFDHIEFDRLDLGVLAITSLNCLGGYRETGIKFNKRADWNCKGDTTASQVDLQTVALHEFGHMLGLGHSGDSRSVMYFLYQGQRRSLAEDDIAGTCFLYPDYGGTDEPLRDVPEAEVWLPADELE